ncbi:MAG: asparaginase [Acidimicrobiia bacterium]
MYGRLIRSDLPETRHALALAVTGVSELASGDVDRHFFMRSAAKPFQAWVCQQAGAGLVPEQLAVAAASHGGEPAHLALVGSMLDDAGVAEEYLACPPSWPRSQRGYQLVLAAGHRRQRRLFHNCSGKHTAMLRACLAQGWPVAGYWETDHPLQARILELMEEVLGHDPGPVGVDGCGVPTFRASARSLAGAFRLLATQPRFAEVADAMHRFAALTAGASLPEAELARVLPAAVKGGAAGCLGVAVIGRLGLAVKSWDGSAAPAMAAASATLVALGLTSRWQRDRLAEVTSPHVHGGGRVVGRLEMVPA